MEEIEGVKIFRSGCRIAGASCGRARSLDAEPDQARHQCDIWDRGADGCACLNDVFRQLSESTPPESRHPKHEEPLSSDVYHEY